MILDAEQARQKASLYTPTAKLVQDIMKYINQACEEGNFRLGYWPEGVNGYTLRHAAEALRKLGYTVTIDDREDDISIWVEW